MPPGGRRWRIGWLLFADPGSNTSRKVFDAFNGAMRDKGWIQGTHYTIDTRSSGGDARRFPALAAELVQVAPDVLMAVETTALVLRQQTTTIPIVLWQSLDPVAAGLVQSLARPGTNVTGLSNVADGLTIKNTEALLEIVPRARRIAVLYDPFWSAATHQIAVARDIARAKGAEVDAYPITADPQSLSAAWAGIDRRRPDGQCPRLPTPRSRRRPATQTPQRRPRRLSPRCGSTTSSRTTSPAPPTTPAIAIRGCNLTTRAQTPTV